MSRVSRIPFRVACPRLRGHDSTTSPRPTRLATRTALVLLLPFATALGQETASQRDPRAVEILEQVDAPTRAVRLVRYDARLEATGWLRPFTGPVEGIVILGGDMSRAKQRFRFDIAVGRAGSATTRAFTGGGDNGSFFLVDHAAKTVHIGSDYGFLGDAARPFAHVRMLEFVHATPFADELNAEILRLQGIAEIAGEKCHEIFVHYSVANLDARWFFSVEDHLPRRVERIRRHPVTGEEGATKLTLRNLAVDPDLAEHPFAPRTPPGYATSPKAP